MAQRIIKGPVDDNSLNSTNHNFTELYNMKNVLQTQINDLVLDSGESNQEVVQARGGHQVLADRLNETEREIEDKKADKIALSQIAQSKRDKNVDIEMKDLSQGVREAMTGGSVAVVGEDSVGEINLKPNSVTTDKIHKNAGIRFPYFSDDTFDLDYFWENKTVIASAEVKNNPFGVGCEVISFRGKTLDTTDRNRVWTTQIAVSYSSDGVLGETKIRHVIGNEATNELVEKSDWLPVGITTNFNVKKYLSDGSYDLNTVIEEGNYYVNSEVENNPYELGGSLMVFRNKLNLEDKFTRIVQLFVVGAANYSEKYLGKFAIRTFRYNEETGEIGFESDWSDKRKEPLKILSISNSFGLNTTNYIHEIANSADVNIITGNLYISGGLLRDHYDNMKENNKAYRYDVKGSVDGVKTDTQTPNVSIDDAIDMEDWDYVFFNQASAQSGVYDTFQPYLNDIITYVESKLPDVKIALMPTWAYSSDFDDTRFDKYDRDQLTMYNDIMDAYKQVMSDVDFDLIIPVGTAVQNARTDDYLMSIDRELTRDGYHLGDTGMYIAGLTFLKTFFGNVKIDWKPSSVSKRAAYFANVAANNSILNPFKVTEI